MINTLFDLTVHVKAAVLTELLFCIFSVVLQ